MEKLLLEEKTDLLKCIIIGIISFGLFGIIWGIGLFYKTSYDLFYLPVVLSLPLGGCLFSILFENRKRTFKRLVLFGSAGGIVMISGGLFMAYPLFLWGGGIIASLLPYILNCNQQAWEAMFMIEPSLAIGGAFLVFALIGFIISAFYALALKIKILSLAKYGATGFALGSLIGPVIGNGILNLSDSLFLTYLTTFFIVCAFLGAFLGLGIYRNLKTENPNSENS